MWTSPHDPNAAANEVQINHASFIREVLSRAGRGPARYTGHRVGSGGDQELIEAQGGQIGIESAGRGQGSRFWFTLPVAAGARPESEIDVASSSSTAGRVPVPAPTGRALRVLVVDDDAAIGAMVRRGTRSSGHETVIIASAEEALERLRTEPFDIVLSDLDLGTGMDGWALAARVRSD